MQPIGVVRCSGHAGKPLIWRKEEVNRLPAIAAALKLRDASRAFELGMITRGSSTVLGQKRAGLHAFACTAAVFKDPDRPGYH